MLRALAKKTFSMVFECVVCYELYEGPDVIACGICHQLVCTQCCSRMVGFLGGNRPFYLQLGYRCPMCRAEIIYVPPRLFRLPVVVEALYAEGGARNPINLITGYSAEDPIDLTE